MLRTKQSDVSLSSSPAPSRRHTTEAAAVMVAPVSNLEPDYETPRTFVDRMSHGSGGGVASAAALGRTGSIGLRRRPINRLSLSPHSEIVEANSRQPPQPETFASPPVAQDVRDDIALTLPKKCLTTQARRFSAFMDPAWTLVGSLHHRYKPKKWTRLNLCLLTSGSRLVAYKSGHSLNPSLICFLCGATAIYAGRDSGRDWVFKIAHSTRGTTVLATDTETQAVAWIRQINLYAKGITPPEPLSLLEHPIQIWPSMLNTPAIPSTVGGCPSVPQTPVHSSVEAYTADTGPCISHPQTGELHEDSGISAPVSGSEGNSGDGVVNHLVMDHRGYPSTIPFEMDPCDPTVTIEPTSTRLRSPTSQSKGSFRLFSRRESLLSSVRRKVVSLGSKRRTITSRKSLDPTPQPPLPFQAPSMDVGVFSKASSSADLRHPAIRLDKCNTIGTDVWSNVGGVDRGPIRRLPLETPRCAGVNGFDWAQLETAGVLFLQSDTVTNQYPTKNALPAKIPARPHSFVAVSTNVALQQSIARNSLDHTKLVDLEFQSSVSNVGDTYLTDMDRVIVCGEACISIPGRVPWTNRWCRLRSRCLDVYFSNQPPTCTCLDRRCSSVRPACATSWPLFTLTLEPGQVELGLAGDKQHRAALRLAVPKQCSAALLFDAPDKIHMGAWIRGFIQALGIISPEHSTYSTTLPFREHENPTSATTTAHFDQPNSLLSEYDLPELVYSQPSYSTPCCDTTSVTDTMDDDLSSEFTDMAIYDEVCSNSTHHLQSRGSLPSTTTKSEVCRTFVRKQRWSNPTLPLGPSIRRVTQTSALLDSGYSHSSWYPAPPPSRRLLAEPLPPLPSVGPSGAESLAGTIASGSHTSSSMATPDELAARFEEEDRLSVANSDPQPHSPRYSSTNKLQSVTKRHGHATRKRHSSLGSLTYAVPYDDPYAPQGSADLIAHPTADNCDDNEMEDTVTTHTGYTLMPDAAGPDGDSARTSMLIQAGCSFDSAYTDGTIEHPNGIWPINLQSPKPSVPARRSVSCMTHPNPSLAEPPVTDPRAIATLPAQRHAPMQSTTNMTKPLLPVTTGPSVDTLWGSSSTQSCSTNSSSSAYHHTATSSGVVLTAGSPSLSSSSCGGATGVDADGSSETTRLPVTDEVTNSWRVAPSSQSTVGNDGVCRTPKERRHMPRPIEPVVDSDEEYHSPVSKEAECSSWGNVLSADRNPTVPTVNGMSTLPITKRDASPVVVGVTTLLKRADTVTGAGSYVDQPNGGRMTSMSGQLNYSPTNASLILVATQLEEVQQGTKKLLSRHKALSFRLSTRLTRESDHTTPLGATTGEGALEATTDTTGTDLVSPESLYDNQGGNLSEEATASLCARLTAIELLIRQAETVETHLRREMNQYMSKGPRVLPTCGYPNNRTMPMESTTSEQAKPLTTNTSRGGNSRGRINSQSSTPPRTTGTRGEMHSRGSRGNSRGGGGRGRRRRNGGGGQTTDRGAYRARRVQPWSRGCTTQPVALSPTV